MRGEGEAQRDRDAEHERGQQNTAQQIEPPVEESVVRVEHGGREAERGGDDAEAEHDRSQDHEKRCVEHQNQQRDPSEDDGNHVIAGHREHRVHVREPTLAGSQPAEKRGVQDQPDDGPSDSDRSVDRPYDRCVTETDRGARDPDQCRRDEKPRQNGQDCFHRAGSMIRERPNDPTRRCYTGNHQRRGRHASIERLIDLRRVSLPSRRANGSQEPCLQFRGKNRIRDPVHRVGNEVTRVEEESKELGQDGQHAAEDIENGTAGAVCALKESCNALQPGGGTPPISCDQHSPSSSADSASVALQRR